MSGAGLWWAGRGFHGRGWSRVGQGEAGLGQDRSAHPSGLQGSLAAAKWRYAAWGWGSAGTWAPLHASGTVKNIKKKNKLEAPLSIGTSPWSPYRKSKSVIYLFPLKNKEVLHQPVCFTSWAPASFSICFGFMKKSLPVEPLWMPLSHLAHKTSYMWICTSFLLGSLDTDRLIVLRCRMWNMTQPWERKSLDSPVTVWSELLTIHCWLYSKLLRHLYILVRRTSFPLLPLDVLFEVSN